MRGGALLRAAAKELFLNLLRTTVINTLSIYPRHPAKRRPTHSWDTTRFSRRSQISRSIARRWLGDEPIVEIGLAMVPQKRKCKLPWPHFQRPRGYGPQCSDRLKTTTGSQLTQLHVMLSRDSWCNMCNVLIVATNRLRRGKVCEDQANGRQASFNRNRFVH